MPSPVPNASNSNRTLGSPSALDDLVLRRMQHSALERWRQKPQTAPQQQHAPDNEGSATATPQGRDQAGLLSVSFSSTPKIKLIQRATDFSSRLTKGDLWYTSSEFDDIEEDAEDTAMGENPFEGDTRGLEMYERGEEERLREQRREVTASVLREQERLRESTGQKTVDLDTLAGVSTNLSMASQDLAYRRAYSDELAARRRRSSMQQSNNQGKKGVLKSITQFFRPKPSGQ